MTQPALRPDVLLNVVPDVLIIGGGLMALATALELRLRGASVTVLSRDRREAAAYAAAGMLAPQAEGLEPGPMLDLCLRSRGLYQDWTAKLESLTGLDSGYWPCGILRPAFADTPPPPELQNRDCRVEWLEGEALEQRQAGLGTEVVGAWWFPEDAQVDNRRRLVPALAAAVEQSGVIWREGVEVIKIHQCQGEVTALETSDLETNGKIYQAGHYLLAAGAWTGGLLEAAPVTPRKGQLMALRPALGAEPQAGMPLGQVLFGDRIYIVPRQDGLIVLGATSEHVAFQPGNTAAGIHQLLTEAIRLCPALASYEIAETWWGFRPETADELPILGPSPLANLSLASGHYRNGVLLAPITAQILADWVLEGKADPLLPAFRWDRLNGLKASTGKA